MRRANRSVPRRAFSLVEMLVVIGTLSALMGVLMPALVTARGHARGVVCRSNVRQLVLANIGYAGEHDGFCVPAAEDLYAGNGGLRRWHGVRVSEDEPFEPNKGPLVDYLADGNVKECPERVQFVQGGEWADHFEQGCGGYGYNMMYLGSRLWVRQMEWEKKYRQTARLEEVGSPFGTLMFADCAMSKQAGKLIEYSFAEPPHFLINGKVFERAYTSPSIHFRHMEGTSVGWVDGHVDRRTMGEDERQNVYRVASEQMQLGWFEPIDNSVFDLQ